MAISIDKTALAVRDQAVDLCLYTAEVLPKVCLFYQISGVQEGAENTKMVNASAYGQPHPAAGVSMSAKPC